MSNGAKQIKLADNITISVDATNRRILEISRGTHIDLNGHTLCTSVQIAMYVIGDDYYLIRFFDDETVMRIHSGAG